MEGILIKVENDWILTVNNIMYATSENAPYARLSMENCQEIERGYNLDELANEWVFETNGHKWSNNDDTAGDNCSSFKAGFHIALELMVNNNFSEADIHEAYSLGEREDRSGFHDLLHLKQQTEWGVEVEMEWESIPTKSGIYMNRIPKLDVDGRLILKLKSE